jgi:N4-(beta-N-acetylglucosaminyl)-L-asparaginase
MSSQVTRRRFFQQGIGLGLGALAAPNLLPFLRRDGRPRTGAGAAVPLIVTSHDNETGHKALEAAWEILAGGGPALDAVEKATNIVEDDAEDMSVGLGGLPNEDGVVQLDASIMDGRTYSAGAVASLENIRHPSSVARLVMERSDHVLLVGPGALEFARSFGFREENLLTEKARQHWLRWRESRSERDDYGPPEHLKPPERGAIRSGDPAFTYGTVNVLALDRNGDVAGITSTSGLSYKIPGRVGDSPIIGAGLYVENGVGAAGATGRGEDVIKSCACYYIVLRMKEGRSPQEACEDALRMIAQRYRDVGLDYLPDEKFVAFNKQGELGCAQTRGTRKPRLAAADESGLSTYEGQLVFPS